MFILCHCLSPHGFFFPFETWRTESLTDLHVQFFIFWKPLCLLLSFPTIRRFFGFCLLLVCLKLSELLLMRLKLVELLLMCLKLGELLLICLKLGELLLLPCWLISFRQSQRKPYINLESKHENRIQNTVFLWIFDASCYIIWIKFWLNKDVTEYW